MRQLVPLFALLVAAGCSASHDRGPVDPPDVDGGRRDGGHDLGCARDVGPIAPPFWCVQADGHVCGDVQRVPDCVGTEWQCPATWRRSDEVECWCSGRPPSTSCTCTPTGWSCALDAGVSGECPSEPGAAEGTPCAEEGRSCGRCTDSCGFCNILRCESGQWMRLEAHPRPPPCTPFECGPELRCAVEFEYCERVRSDVGGFPDDYACRALPASCSSCDCLPESGTCERGSEGGLTVTFPGG
ncbi:hypothetical protein [Sandaracinus amylolyticus]|uniref:Tryptophan synthase alpha chain n=1 Tax=Sandaracinus amylolyticus TaxID=927083 RepID=A0A0F6SGW6_9BACT|nr:hypothetical protein [Sandaracinus amylolyticus]AKF09409.1 hypothetical protein DB32_006558 [Sandaracinus amylolyticus]